MKTCNKCGLEQTKNNFTADPRNKDGLQSICLGCHRIYKQKARQKRLQEGPSIIVSEKKCNGCGEIHPVGEFYKDAGIADGYSTICKKCRDKSMNRYRDANRDRYNANMREWRASNKEEVKDMDLRRCYGIGLEDYNAMLAAQNHTCAICEKPQKGKRPLVVDHCHTTGKVRQLLCYGCNRLIVALDKHPLHEAIVRYLKKHA